MKLRSVAIACLLSAACVFTTSVADEPGTSRLAKVLTGRNEILRLQAIRSFGNDLGSKLAALDDLVFALREHGEQLSRGRDLPNSTVELVGLIASIDRPESREVLIELVDSPQMQMAMICADTLGREQCFEAIDAIKMQVERPEWNSHYGFRFNVVRSLAQMEHPDAYDFLKLIQGRVDGQLLHELNLVLENVTLDDFRGDEQRFATWKQPGVPSRAPIAEAGDATKRTNSTNMSLKVIYSNSQNPVKLARPRYYGIEIEAKRTMFIIDHSGSMKSPVYRGTRLSHAKAELARVLKALPEDHEFAIVFYEEAVRSWRSELLPATEENKNAAIRFIGKLGYGKSTNTYGALREALDFDDDLESVFLLSDGAPTSGTIVAQAAIINDIVLRNRLRHLTINTIGIGVGGPTRLFLKTLAEKCGGEFREARMR